jgi:uncharacterized membrane protein YkvA (DUF1232 family)
MLQWHSCRPALPVVPHESQPGELPFRSGSLGTVTACAGGMETSVPVAGHKAPQSSAASPAPPAAQPSAERIQIEAMLSEGGGVSTFSADPPRGAPLSSAPPSEMSTVSPGPGMLADSLHRVARSFGYHCLKHLAHRRGRVSESLRSVSDDARRRADQTRLALGLIDDFKDGTFRDVPWTSVALLAGALVYIANPRDLIPDFVPVLGALDDLTLLTLAVRMTQKDLRAYCHFKGYREEDYFEPLAAES